MHSIRLFKTVSLLVATLLTAASARAGSVVLITNLDPNSFPVTTVSPTAVTGQSFVAGTSMLLAQVKIELDPNNLPTSAPSLVIKDSVPAVDANSQNFYAPNAIVYTGLTLSSTDTDTGILTYSATSPFMMTEGVNYWLVATPTGADTGLTWSFTQSGNPSTIDGYTIQPNDASFYSNPDNSLTYVNPGEGVQLFQIDAQAVPEPSSISLAVIAVCALCALEYRRNHPRRCNSRAGTD